MDPIEFSIHHSNWTVEVVDGDVIEGNLGLTVYNDDKIYIAYNDKHKIMRRTLIHEMTHAFRWSYCNVSDAESMAVSSDELEEIIARTVEAYAEDILDTVDYVWKIIEENFKKGRKK